MKKIFCVLCQKNKFLPSKKPLFQFIKVQLLHLPRQLVDSPSFSMNQMHLVVVVYRLWREIYLVSYRAAGAMNLAGCHYNEVH